MEPGPPSHAATLPVGGGGGNCPEAEPAVEGGADCPNPEPSAATRPSSSGEPAAAAPAAAFAPEEIDRIVEALLAAKRTARNHKWEAVAGLEGWSIRWQKRGGGSGKGDTYWQTPKGDEVRSRPISDDVIRGPGQVVLHSPRATKPYMLNRGSISYLEVINQVSF